MSQITKKALASSLKKMLTTKRLDKITVTDITNDCEVKRQTFYYHFQDIYDLLEWMFESDGMRVLEGKKTYSTWQMGYLQILNYMKENQKFIINVYNSLSRDYLEKFLYRETYELLHNVLEEQTDHIFLNAENKEFIVSFYKYAFVGLTLEWIEGGMKESVENITERLSTIMNGNFSRAIEAFKN